MLSTKSLMAILHLRCVKLPSYHFCTCVCVTCFRGCLSISLACVPVSARQRFPLHISQDGNDSAVAELASNPAAAVHANLDPVDPADLPHVVHMQHVQQDSFPSRAASEPIAYYRISSHYKFVMQQLFDCWQYPKLIILEVGDTTAASSNAACTAADALIHVQFY